MMGIYIKGMEMPESCVDCPLAKNYGMCAITKKTFNWGNPNRLSDCPLIEILPHGRLIDADAIPYIFGSTHATEYDTVTKFVINKLPTIVEAEET